MKNQHRYTSATPEAEAVVCNRACRFNQGIVANFSGGQVWIWLCDGGTTQPLKPSGVPILLENNETRLFDWDILRKHMSSGLYVCASTSPVTKTLIVPTATSGVLFEIAVEV